MEQDSKNKKIVQKLKNMGPWYFDAEYGEDFCIFCGIAKQFGASHPNSHSKNCLWVEIEEA
jgi:hypothetical protein